MKTSVVFGIVLACFIFSVGAKNIEPDPHGADSPNKISFDIEKFIKENPDLVIASKEMMMTQCECAVFDTQSPTTNSTPILTHTPFNISCKCDSKAEEACRKLCADFAETAKDNGLQLLCTTLGHYNDLLASVHSRIGGSEKWTYTGASAPNKICCHDHQVIDCKNQVENKVQNQL